MNIQNKMQKELDKIRKIRVEIISNEREIRQTCDACDRIIMWNVRNRWEEFKTIESSDNVNEKNSEIPSKVNISVE